MTKRPAQPAASRTQRPAHRDAPITPLKLPRHVKTVVVFGGSFDPPHFMHTSEPLWLTEEVFGDTAWLLYVPASRSPHKGDEATFDQHRLAMLRYAIELPGQRSIWTDELDRATWAREHKGTAAPSFTIDTLRRLRAIIPHRISLRLLIGSDQVARFHEWKEPREIIKLAEPLVMLRPPIDAVSTLWQMLRHAKYWTREESLAWLTRLAPLAEVPVSSTDLRKAIPGAPKSLKAWFRREELLPVTEGVARHIIRYNLYGHRPGGPRPLDPKDMPPAPVGNYPGFIEHLIRFWDTDGMSDALWAKVFRKIDPKTSRSQIPAYARPITRDLASKRSRNSKPKRTKPQRIKP